MQSNTSRKIALFFGGLMLAIGMFAFAVIQKQATAKPAQPKAELAKVVIFWDTDCPVAQAYSARLQQTFESNKDFASFKMYYPNEGASDSKISKYKKDFRVSVPYAIDFGAVEAKKYAVKVVPEILVFDKNNNLVYRGTIDDNKISALARSKYLDTVLSNIKNSQPISVQNSAPVGCSITPSKLVSSMEKFTYAEHVATIIDRSCVGCHRPGQTAPFSLVGYENVKSKANMIAVVTAGRQMPPWKATQGYGEFHDENVLSEREVAILDSWAKNNAPSGDLKKAPKPREFSKGIWSLGTPDLIVAPSKSFKIYADGHDIYRQFIVKTNLKEPKWVKTMDVVPGNRRVVHHVIAFLDNAGRAQKLEQENTDGQLGYSTFGGPGFIPSGSFGGWAPGLSARKLPSGAAYLLKPGEDIVIQVHYHPTGKPEEDLTQIGLYFADEKQESISHNVSINWLIKIPLIINANDPASKHIRKFPIPVDYQIFTVMPHMHLLGQTMKAWIETPDGKTEPLVEIKKWDFNWQMNYALKTPKIVKAGSKVVVEAIYDNSENNPNNPHSPPQRVTWGEETTDEMFLLVVAGSPVDPTKKMDLYSFD